MVILFIIHNTIHWEPWMVAGTGLILLVILAKEIEFEDVMKNMTHEIPLLMFFVALFMLVGGVEGSKFLEYLGQYIVPFIIDPESGEVIQENFMMTCIALMWVAAIMSAAIDNIPFTAAMIPGRIKMGLRLLIKFMGSYFRGKPIKKSTLPDF